MAVRSKTLTAALGAVDRTALASLIQALETERRDAADVPGPLAFRQRARRGRCLQELLDLENLLQRASSDLGTWHATLKPAFKVKPVLPLYEQQQMIPPVAVRNIALQSRLYLVRLTTTLQFSLKPASSSLRLSLLFDPGRAKLRRTTAYAVFPRQQLRTIGAVKIRFGLRPNLTFWSTPIPALPRPTTRGSRRSSPPLLLGPMSCSLKGIGTTAVGAGASHVDLYVSHTDEVDSGSFETWLLLRVPRGRLKVTLKAQMEAELPLPVILRPILGSKRFLRGEQTWNLPLPAPGRIPERAD